MLFRLILSACAVVISASAAIAAELHPVTLEPITHAEAELVLVHPDGHETSYTPETLENFPTYRLRTTTPWRDEPADFDGILLRDLLASAGLDSLDQIRTLAENDYSTTIPRELWENVTVLVATRVDGEPHTRRARGPIQFVIPMDEYTSSPVANESYLVWMAARIQPE
ncbi:hypothetical protein ACJ5NV_07790 [Loktanella agnita]|uniref:hypothetical protein n=1 Tax=Loktanella agnita TaxID=287097 RepID=UPI003985BE30